MGVNLCNLQSDVMPSKKLLEWAYAPIDMKHFPGDWYYFKEAQTLLVDFMNKVWEGRQDWERQKPIGCFSYFESDCFIPRQWSLRKKKLSSCQAIAVKEEIENIIEKTWSGDLNVILHFSNIITLLSF